MTNDRTGVDAPRLALPSDVRRILNLSSGFPTWAALYQREDGTWLQYHFHVTARGFFGPSFGLCTCVDLRSTTRLLKQTVGGGGQVGLACGCNYRAKSPDQAVGCGGAWAGGVLAMRTLLESTMTA